MAIQMSGYSNVLLLSFDPTHLAHHFLQGVRRRRWWTVLQNSMLAILFLRMLLVDLFLFNSLPLISIPVHLTPNTPFPFPSSPAPTLLFLLLSIFDLDTTFSIPLSFHLLPLNSSPAISTQTVPPSFLSNHQINQEQLPSTTAITHLVPAPDTKLTLASLVPVYFANVAETLETSEDVIARVETAACIDVWACEVEVVASLC
ncbi:MAG: hypothetical protein Q9204_000840 [Flavoplaca sp. TL-2023a]